MQIRDLIQVAGVIDRAEAELLIECGIQYLGFPLRLPVHREDLSEDEAARIIRDLPAECHAVLITYLSRADEIVEFCRSLGARIVQLHGDVDPAELRRIKQLQPGLSIIKSLVIGLGSDSELRRTLRESAPAVDAYITDTYDPGTGASGATGMTHDWAVSRDLVRLSEHPVILAGGLTPENVREAIRIVQPAGVDAHTGLEDSAGRKDRELVQRFVAEANAGFLANRTK